MIALSKAYRSERGMALVTTLLVVAILVTIVVELVYSVYGHARSTRLHIDSTQASLLASSAVEMEAIRLGVVTGEGNFTYLSPDERDRKLSFDNNEARLKVADEQGKIALNQIVAQNGELVPERFELFRRLLNVLDLPEELAYSTADWIDADDDAREGGAESAYYKELKPAYAPKNSALHSVDELLLVKGFDSATVSRLKPFVTVYTDGLININGAPREVIMALDKEISPDMAESVVSARDASPFESTARIRDLAGFGAIPIGLEARIVTKSATFRVESAGKAGEARRFVESVVKTLADGNSAAASFKTLYWRER